MLSPAGNANEASADFPKERQAFKEVAVRDTALHKAYPSGDRALR